MASPYNTQQQNYTEGNGPYYALSDNQNQNPVNNSTYSAEDYETRPPHQEQGFLYDQPHYDAHSTQSQGYIHMPGVYHPQGTDTQTGYLHPSSATPGAGDYYQHDDTRLSPHYEPRQGSNAEYYGGSNLHEEERSSSPGPSEMHENRKRGDDRDGDGNGDGEEGERGLGGALVGGATGYYLGHKKKHGFLGAVGGALLGNFLENRIDERNDDRHSESSSSHHGRRHRHHHHHHHHSRDGSHRSRSRHSHRSTES